MLYPAELRAHGYFPRVSRFAWQRHSERSGNVRHSEAHQRHNPRHINPRPRLFVGGMLRRSA